MHFPVIWLTGHSGAGKTTLAKELRGRLYMDGEWPVILDGDDMRESITRDCDLSAEGRAVNNYRIAHLARVLSRQVPVIVAVIAPSADVRQQVDQLIRPVWVYVKRSLPEREGHWYVQPLEYHEDPTEPSTPRRMFSVDHDELSPKEAAAQVEEHVDRMRGQHAAED